MKLNKTMKMGGAVLAMALGSSAANATVSVSAVNANAAGATALVNALLGSGITLVGTPTLTGSATSSGTYTGGASAGIGIDTGILLTTGSVNNAPGPNNSDSSSATASGNGDADLNALVGGNTSDSSTLEFSFQFGDGTVGGDLFFNYVFASEEYNEYVGTQFNDVFGFFLDGVNIALIPSTSTPVAINTVNGSSNPALYNNNDLQDGGPFHDIEYDGFTDVLTASKLGLAPGTHTIKLAISDRADEIYDSGVFLQGNSFSDTPLPPTGVPDAGSTLAMLGLGALGLMGLRRKLNA
jgi:hypothetical protein